MCPLMRAMPQIGQGNSILETLHPKLLDSMSALPEYMIQRIMRNFVADAMLYVPISSLKYLWTSSIPTSNR